MPENTLTLEILNQRVATLEKQAALPPSHYHNGFDSNKISWIDLDQKILYMGYTLEGATPATAANYGVFLIVPAPCLVTAFREVHATAGTDVGAVTLDLEKLSGTTAPGSGSTALNATLSLKATANTVQAATITSTGLNKTLAAGDRLALKLTGTPTSVAGVSILLALQLL